MANAVILGAQWGDEGKGKIVDYLTENADVVARYQGGPNAGHTIVIGDKKFILHIIPSGIFHPNKLCMIGNGVIIHPAGLLNEIEQLKGNGIDLSKLILSQYAHVIMPYHLAIEREAEQSMAGKKIGTTLRGIGPTYSDKIGRNGVRVMDLFDPDMLRERVFQNLTKINCLLTYLYKAEPLNGEAIVEEYLGYADSLKPYVHDTTDLINRLIKGGKKILFEGAQGVLLDIDHGTYPYVTSSSASAGGVCTGLGVAPRHIHEVIGAVKAYTTRVGEGPFPTELNDEIGEQIRKIGGEYGSTTGRPRRCGWLDCVALQHAATINGLTGLALTKLDVLDSLDKIKVCTTYRYQRQSLPYMPRDVKVLAECEPIYYEMDGWKTSTKGVSRYEDLPLKARQFIEMIELAADTPVDIISTGPKREEIIVKRNPLV
jgi:adenylosuccinate synthase